MIEPELLKILRCPETRQELSLAQPALVDQLNRQIAAGALQNRAGQLVKDKIEAGLLRADGQFLYPIRRNIPVLLVEEALPVGAGVSG